MNKLKTLAIALVGALAATIVVMPTEASPVPPTYAQGKIVYFRNELAKIQGCDINSAALEKQLQAILAAHNSVGITPVVVFTKQDANVDSTEAAGTTDAVSSNKTLIARWTKQGLPAATYVAITVVCAGDNVHFAAATPGNGLRPPLLELAQWKAIESNARPNLKVQPEKYVTQVVEGLITQVETNRMAAARIEQEKKAAQIEADHKAAEAKLFQEQQNKLAKTDLAKIDAEHSGGSHWLLWTVVILFGLGGIIWLVMRRSTVKVVTPKRTKDNVTVKSWPTSDSVRSRPVKRTHFDSNKPAQSYTRVVHGRPYTVVAPTQTMIMNDPLLRQWYGTPYYGYYYNNWLDMYMSYQVMDMMFHGGDRLAAERMGYREGMQDAWMQQHLGALDHDTNAGWNNPVGDGDWTVGGADLTANPDPADSTAATRIDTESGWTVGGGDNKETTDQPDSDFTVGGGDSKVTTNEPDSDFTVGSGNDDVSSKEPDSDWTVGGGNDDVSTKEPDSDWTVGGGNDDVSTEEPVSGFTVGGGNDDDTPDQPDTDFNVGGGNDNDTPDAPETDFNVGGGNDDWS